MGIFTTTFDVSLSVFIGGPILANIVVLGKVNNKGALGGVKSKGGILVIPIVETSLGICCCCIMCEKSNLSVLFGYFGRVLFPLSNGGSSNKGLMLMYSNVLWRISILGGINVFKQSNGSLFKSKSIMGSIVSSVG